MGRLLDTDELAVTLTRTINKVDNLDLKTKLLIIKACKDEFDKLETAVIGNKDALKDHICALLSIKALKEYLADNESMTGGGCSVWISRDGDHVSGTDIGYFFDGLDVFEEYITNKIIKSLKEEQ